MGTASQLAARARDSGYDLRVIGIPKTIDNDLAATDHSPGYPSTAPFFACAVRDIGADNRALPGQVQFIEVWAGMRARSWPRPAWPATSRMTIRTSSTSRRRLFRSIA